MSFTVGVVQFPGTNCEMDVVEAFAVLGITARTVWHQDRNLNDIDGVVIAGGFAHGDYLRPGAIARFSPIMESVNEFARSGGPVLGICNGFQVLTESGLLPGALQKNAGLKFHCEPCELEVVSTASVLTARCSVGDRLNIPINHFEGNFTCDAPVLRRLGEQDQVVLRYVRNPNGSVGDIAGIRNESGNVVGLMPHPERASHALLGSTDGLALLASFAGNLEVSA